MLQLGYDYVSLSAGEMRRARAGESSMGFYATAVGCRPIDRWAGGAFLVGSPQILAGGINYGDIG